MSRHRPGRAEALEALEGRELGLQATAGGGDGVLRSTRAGRRAPRPARVDDRRQLGLRRQIGIAAPRRAGPCALVRERRALPRDEATSTLAWGRKEPSRRARPPISSISVSPTSRGPRPLERRSATVAFSQPRAASPARVGVVVDVERPVAAARFAQQTVDPGAHAGSGDGAGFEQVHAGSDLREPAPQGRLVPGRDEVALAQDQQLGLGDLAAEEIDDVFGNQDVPAESSHEGARARRAP